MSSGEESESFRNAMKDLVEIKKLSEKIEESVHKIANQRDEAQRKAREAANRLNQAEKEINYLYNKNEDLEEENRKLKKQKN